MIADEFIELIAADESDPRIQAAVAELRERILEHYPAATFEVVRGEDPEGIYLIPTIDVDDLEEVATVFEPRLVDMQVEEGLPVYVFPDWPLERIREQLRQKARDRATSETVVPTPTAVG
ncbi:MAG: hypothetical protein H0W06_00880 [Chloroflexia bacterium]|nr:hypothetical protein [Chloroflexia bacterium]